MLNQTPSRPKTSDTRAQPATQIRPPRRIEPRDDEPTLEMEREPDFDDAAPEEIE